MTLAVATGFEKHNRATSKAAFLPFMESLNTEFVYHRRFVSRH